MENASRALMIAAGVLIGVLIASLAVYVFTDLGGQAARVNSNNEQKRIESFNSQFTAYTGYFEEDTSGNKTWKITIYDIVTLRGKAKENNNTSPDKITIKIGNTDITTSNDSDNALLSKYTAQDGKLETFSCDDKDIKYSNSGKISEIVFKTTGNQI